MMVMATCWVPDKRYSERERWICIYPAYINSKKTIAEGRVIAKDKCVENPTCQEIRDVLDQAGFQIGVENKLYPREQNKDNITFRGRVRVQLRNDDGTPCKPNFPSRKSILNYVCENIPKLKSRTSNKGAGDQGQNSQNAPKKKGKKGKR